MRSWPELKLDAKQTEPPRHTLNLFFFKEQQNDKHLANFTKQREWEHKTPRERRQITKIRNERENFIIAIIETKKNALKIGEYY